MAQEVTWKSSKVYNVNYYGFWKVFKIYVFYFICFLKNVANVATFFFIYDTIRNVDRKCFRYLEFLSILV